MKKVTMYEIEARCSVALDIYSSLIKKSKVMCDEMFGKPTSYYDAERQRILSMAHDLFTACVTIEDILALAKERPKIPVEDVTAASCPRNPEEIEISRDAVLNSNNEDDEDIDYCGV